jgi:hypothetical protein
MIDLWENKNIGKKNNLWIVQRCIVMNESVEKNLHCSVWKIPEPINQVEEGCRFQTRHCDSMKIPTP